MPPDLTAHMWLFSIHCRCQNHATQQSRAVWEPKVCALHVSLPSVLNDPIRRMTAGRRFPENSRRHYASTVRSWGSAFMSFIFFHSKDYISGEVELDDLPSEGKRKQMASRRRRGQRGVRPRLRPKTGVSPPCLVNNQIQSLWLPIPLPVWG